MSAALAMLLWVAPAKNTARFGPKKSGCVRLDDVWPGAHRRTLATGRELGEDALPRTRDGASTMDGTGPIHRSCEATSRRAPPATRRTANRTDSFVPSDGRAVLSKSSRTPHGGRCSGRSPTWQPTTSSRRRRSADPCAIGTSHACAACATHQWPARRTRVGAAAATGPLTAQRFGSSQEARRPRPHATSAPWPRRASPWTAGSPKAAARPSGQPQCSGPPSRGGEARCAS